MKKEIIKYGFYIQVGDQFASEWSEPQFTSYYLSSFDNACLFRTKELAEKEAIRFKDSEIKRVKKTITIELDPSE